MTDPHADLRAMLEALPADIQWEPQCGRIELRAPDGLTHVQMDDLMSWLLRAPALVRALLEERDELAERDASAKRHDYAEITLRAERDALKADRDKLTKQLADMRPRAEVYVTAECHHEAKRAWEQERDELSTDIENLTGAAIKVDAALGEDRKRAPYAFEAVKLLREERDALKAEVERLRAHPMEPCEHDWQCYHHTVSGEDVTTEFWTLTCSKCRMVHPRPPKRLTPDEMWKEHAVALAHPAEPIPDELRLRCEMAGRHVPAWVVEGHFNNHNVTNAEVAKVAHNIADALLAEGRRRMAAEREGKP